MCVRYNSRRDQWEQWVRAKRIWVDIPPPSDKPVQEELFPGRIGYFAWATNEGYTLDVGRFGLMPNWQKPPVKQWSKGFYNARAEGSESRGEGIENMSAFRDAFRHRRCVVPMQSYYENADVGQAAAEKRYVEVFPTDAPAFLMAAIYEPPNHICPDFSFALVTTASHGPLAEVHSRRLAILDDESLEVWRDPGAPIDALKEILWPRGPEPIRIEEAERPMREKKAKAEAEEPPTLL